MNAIVVDTSAWIPYLAGRPNTVVDEAIHDGRVFLPPIVLAEIFSGKLNHRRRQELREAMERLPLCDCRFDHWIRVGELRASLMAAGITISIPDAHVAQCAMDLSGILVTEDKIFHLAADHCALQVVR